MQYSFVILAVFVAYASARVYYPEPITEYETSDHARHARDVTWDRQVGGGKVFGTLGGNEDQLYGKAGYQKQFFNDHRGKLEGQAYGSRVLGPDGGSSHFGGKLDWSDQNARAAVDVSRQIGGRTSLSASGDGVWNLDKNSRLSAGGTFRQEHLGHGRPDVGVQAQYERNF